MCKLKQESKINPMPMKSLKTILALLGLMITSVGISQQITGLEYFFNSDPGIGNGTPVALTSPGDSVTVDFSINLSALSPGFQELYVRTQDADGHWSISEARAFYILEPISSQASAQLLKAEYFFDTDPGIGMANSFTLATSADSVEEFHDIPIGNLSPGFHELYVRISDASNLWSLSEARSFYVMESNFAQDSPAIKAVEYFFDTDPGVGSGTALSLTEGDSIDQVLSIALPTLEKGFHKLFIRVKDASGFWSIAESRSFYILDAATLSPSSPIAKAEYFFDADPGIGNGIEIVSSLSSDTVDLNFNIDLTGRALGEDTLYVRVIDEAGVSSLYEYALFEISDKTVDIKTSGLDLQDTVTQPGSPVELSYTLSNVGELDLTDEFSLDTYLSFDEMLSEEDILLSSETISDGIVMGSSINREETISIPEETASGEVFILVCADKQNIIPEFNDDNNVATASLTIDNAPEVTDQVFNIAENSPAGTKVDTVVATDPDNDPLSFTITSGNTSNAFAIESSTGEITVNTTSALDYETTPTFGLGVEVSDGSLTASATITINVTDVDEEGNHPPEITDQTFSVSENSGAGTQVGTVNAVDPDGDDLSFSITHGNDGNAFAIEPTTGVLTVNSATALDYETTPVFTLTVEVNDGTESAEAIITVNLTNAGDNTPPVIENQTFNVDENSAYNTYVGTIAASDPEGDEISFTLISGNNGNAFAIDAQTGDITVVSTGMLDYEERSEMQLTVQASDGSLSSEASIRIEINDVDENTAIEDIRNKIAVYPNPASSKVIIQIDKKEYKLKTIKLYNTYGQLLKQVNASRLVAGEPIVFDLGENKAGLYIIQLTFNEFKIQKLVQKTP